MRKDKISTGNRYQVGKKFKPLADKQRPTLKPKALELQIDYSESQLPFYEEVPDQNFGVSSDHSTV